MASRRGPRPISSTVPCSLKRSRTRSILARSVAVRSSQERVGGMVGVGWFGNVRVFTDSRPELHFRNELDCGANKTWTACKVQLR